MTAVSLYATVSIDGFIADDNDDIGPLFDWYSNGDVALTEDALVSRVSADYTKPRLEEITVVVCGRHVFDLMDGWGGDTLGAEHVVVVSHRPRPDGWHPEAPYHFVNGVAEAVEKAKELAGAGTVEIAAGDVGGQALTLGLVDVVAMDIVPVVFGSGKRFFGSVDAQHLLEDPDVVVKGNRVLHLSYRVRA